MPLAPPVKYAYSCDIVMELKGFNRAKIEKATLGTTRMELADGFSL